ncbi:hypothetical protein JI435_157200, partial [Parastagonospora nodorum SN15]
SGEEDTCAQRTNASWLHGKPTPTNDTHLAPSTPSAMIIMLDLDAPFSDSRASRLHWLATGLTPSSTTPSVSALANLTIPNAQVSYEAPDPPIGDVAHTYAFYLIGVPASFTPPAGSRAEPRAV